MDLPDLARSRAVLIGNGAYAEHPRIPNLPGAQACVQAMSALLTGPLCGWPNDRITVLIDVSAPHKLARQVHAAVRDAEDVLLVYYVGHGMSTSEGQLALAVGETDPDPELLAHTATLYENLARILRGSRARTKLVILDCCHAELGHRANYIFQSADLAEAYPVDGLYFIGASARDAKAKAPAGGGLTYFTDAFVTTVTTGIPRQPPTLRLDQIFLELRARLLRANLPEPVEAGTRGAHQYPFARNAAPQELLLDPDAEIARLLRETADAEARERALREEHARELLRIRRRKSRTAPGTARYVEFQPLLGPVRTVLNRRDLLITAAVAALGSGIGGAVWALLPDPPPPAQALGPPLTGFSSSVTSVAFAPDSHTLATADFNSVRLWNTTNPAHPTALGSPLDSGFNSSMAFAPDGRVLATGNGLVQLWNITVPSEPTKLGLLLRGVTDNVTSGLIGGVTSMAFTPDGHTLATGNASGVWLWNVTDPTNPALLGSPLTHYFTDSVISVAFTSDSRTLAACDGSTVQLWNITNLANPTALASPVTGVAGTINAVAFPDDHTLATGNGYSVQLWNITNPLNPSVLASILTGVAGTVTSVAFTPRGNTLAIGVYDEDADVKNATVQLWNITDPTHPAALGSPLPLTGGDGNITSVAFTPDGHTLAAGGTIFKTAQQTGAVQLWALR